LGSRLHPATRIPPFPASHPMARKILLTLASGFLAWQSVGLVVNIVDVQFRSWWVLIFTAWVINMFVTGIFAFMVFAHPAQRLLPEAYYRIRNPDALKRLHSGLRVDLFRRFLLATFWRGQAQRDRYFNGQRSGLEGLDEQSRKSEFGHAVPFVVLSLVAVYLLIEGMPGLALGVALINVVGNFYPVLLQRHHRMRLERVQRRVRPLGATGTRAPGFGR
jgi:hypothetical protein